MAAQAGIELPTCRDLRLDQVINLDKSGLYRSGVNRARTFLGDFHDLSCFSRIMASERVAKPSEPIMTHGPFLCVYLPRLANHY